MKLRYDLYYVKYMSIALDVGIPNAQVPTSKDDSMLAVWASR